MPPRPSRAAEALLAILLPPACREEVLGDLYERYRSGSQYAFEALRTVPLVILSRIRRTVDPQVLVMQALGLYLSFLGAARFQDPVLLAAPWGLTRLALPAGIMLLALILDDAYAAPGKRSPLAGMRGPVIGLGLALFSQGVFQAGKTHLALPLGTLFYGCGIGFLLSCAIRMLFPPALDQLQGANAPAFWLKRAGGADPLPPRFLLAVKMVAALACVAVAGTWLADELTLPKPRVISGLLLLVIAVQLCRRS